MTAETTRRVTRSTTDRVIGGVAGGLGRYFRVDPVVVRLAFIVATFLGGVGVIAYLAAWLIIPRDGEEGEGFDWAGFVRRFGIGLGILVLMGVALIGGLFGFASGGTATAIVVIGVGALLILGAFTGGMRWLIAPAIVLALAAGVAAAANLDIRGGTGERIYQPVSASTLRSNYALGMGHLRLDLRRAKLGPGPHRVHLKLGIGQAEVLVPRNVCVSSTAHIAGGATTVFDRETGGAYHDWSDIHNPPARTPHLIVSADIGFGQLRIEHDVFGQDGQEGACSND
jgi:phage shock protein PspC (stress-responsive transcriptional regulator)